MRAAATGLAWECVADGELLDRAVALAGPGRGRAARSSQPGSRPRSVTRPWQASFDDALRAELEHQVWSFRQPEFTDRMNASRRRALTARPGDAPRAPPHLAPARPRRLRSRP